MCAALRKRSAVATPPTSTYPACTSALPLPYPNFHSANFIKDSFFVHQNFNPSNINKSPSFHALALSTAPNPPHAKKAISVRQIEISRNLVATQPTQ